MGRSRAVAACIAYFVRGVTDAPKKHFSCILDAIVLFLVPRLLFFALFVVCTELCCERENAI